MTQRVNLAADKRHYSTLMLSGVFKIPMLRERADAGSLEAALSAELL